MQTYEGGCARAKAGEGQQAVPCLLHAHYHIVLGVQEGRYQLQAVALQHLDVQRHALGVALHRPYLRQRQALCTADESPLGFPAGCSVFFWLGVVWCGVHNATARCSFRFVA